MTTQYYVIAETTCRECRGTGWVTHPSWVLFFEQHPDPGSLTDENIAAFFDLDALIPDSEMICPDCEGNQIITSRVSLSQALHEMRAEIAVLDARLSPAEAAYA